MAEAEEVVTDVARHATVFVRDLWRRHRDEGTRANVPLAAVASRIDLLVTSVFGVSIAIRTAQPPAPPTLLGWLFARQRLPRVDRTLPATDGRSLWLPGDVGIHDPAAALDCYRAMGLQQAMRAHRGSAGLVTAIGDPLIADVYLLLEAAAADVALKAALPGLGPRLAAGRLEALEARPPVRDFPPAARPLEAFVRDLLRADAPRFRTRPVDTASPAASLAAARQIARELHVPQAAGGGSLLLKDWWTGELRSPSEGKSELVPEPSDGQALDDPAPPASRLARRPETRDAKKDEDDEPNEGTWMVQADEPHRKAEDPMGLKRPTDRGEEDAADAADMLTELPEVRTVKTPGRPKEFLLSDDPPESRLRLSDVAGRGARPALEYPEWDYRSSTYRLPGATVRVLPVEPGPASWVERTLDEHRAMLRQIRRRFEMLRARRIVLRKQQDGEDIDLDACVDALADLRAGSYADGGLYRTCRPVERNMTILLLIDVSGSTDGWVSANRRIIDVEREALLLVGIALKELNEPYAIQAFSGEGRDNVTIRPVKAFEEEFDHDVALRIAALEPERFTRAGAAIRHATASLMQQPADHRLLLLLSDGKPNDNDRYEGRYGVEDMHRAVTEARLQGVFPFCLTIDRQAASYLPRIFGANQYALLQRPGLLPTVLLDWMRRLVTARQS